MDLEFGDNQMQVRLTVSVEQDADKVQSKLTVQSIAFKATWSTGNGGISGTVKLDDVTAATMEHTATYYCPITLVKGQWQTISMSHAACSATPVTLKHNENGEKSVAVKLQYWIRNVYGDQLWDNRTFTATLTLPTITIATASTITASNCTLGQQTTITITKGKGSTTETITWKSGTESGTIAASNTSTSVKWTPSKNLANQVPNGTSVSVTITADTYYGSKKIGTSTATISCAVPSDIVPTLSITVSDPTGVQGDLGEYIQSLSKARVVSTASGSYGSTIKSYAVKVGDKSGSTADYTAELPNSGSITVSCTVTDSRGRTASKSQTLSVRAYSALASTISSENMTMGSASTITVTKFSSKISEVITYTCGTASGTIASANTSTSLSWIPSKDLAKQIPNSTSTTVTILAVSKYSGSEVGRKSIAVTCTVPADISPSLSIAVSDPSGVKDDLGTYVQNLSKAKVVSTAAGSYGSTIKSYAVKVGGKSGDTASYTADLPNSGNVEISCTVTDSRGRTASQSTTISVLAYASLTSNISCGNTTMGTEATVNVVKYSRKITEDITWSCGSASGTIATGNTANSLKWTPSKDIARQVTNGTVTTVTVLAVSKYNGNEVGRRTIYVSSAVPADIVPTLNWTISDTAGHLAVCGGYVQNQSKARVVSTASGSYGSTIKSYAVKIGNITGSTADVTASLPDPGTVSISCTVTDSRGRTASKSTTITVLAYTPPKATISAIGRSNASGGNDPQGAYGKITWSITATTIKGSTVTTTATITKRGTTEQTQNALSGTSGNYVFAASTADSYEAKITVKDRFGSADSIVWILPPGFVLMDFDKANRAVGIGAKAAKADTLNMGLDIDMNGKKISGAKSITIGKVTLTEELLTSILNSI